MEEVRTGGIPEPSSPEENWKQVSRVKKHIRATDQ